MFRSIIFWAHLSAGLIAGIFVLTMSATGVLLTYERQFIDRAIAGAVAAPSGAEPLGADAMIATTLARGAEPGSAILLPRDPEAPAFLPQGRQRLALDPYTGAPMEDAGAGTRAFFDQLTSFHRWLSLSGRNETGGAVIGASNLLFLFLVASGIYLWLPPVFRWSLLRMRLLFRRGLPTAQARDHNWHHVFGVWALIPLFVIALSGVVMSYSWANGLVFSLVGEEAPQGRPRGGPPPLPAELEGHALAGPALSYDALLTFAAAEAPDWRRATVILPGAEDAYLRLTMDEGNGVQPSALRSLVVDRASGEIVAGSSGAAVSPGMKLRGWLRFAHTGEIYGVVGQTVAGLASLAAIILVYTGVSLGIRRLARMARRRRARSA